MSNFYKNKYNTLNTITVPSNESMLRIESMAAKTVRAIITHAKVKYFAALLLVPALLIPIMGFIQKDPEQSHSGALNLNTLELLPLKNDSGKDCFPASGVIAVNNKIDEIYQITKPLQQAELAQREDTEQTQMKSRKFRALKTGIKESPNFIQANNQNTQIFLSPYLIGDKQKKVKINYSSRKNAIAPYVNRYADKFGLDRDLIMSIIQVESNFISHAVSKHNAHGLMQIVPSTAGAEVNRFFKHNRELSNTDLMHPENNIYYGTAYLYLLKRYHLDGITNHDSLNYLLIASYNAGSGAILRHFGATKEQAVRAINAMTPQQVYTSLTLNYRSAETRNYVRRVTENLS